jgi:hypothetical protein
MITRTWNGISIVQISLVDNKEEFAKWLYGQTLPWVEEDENPTDWAYYADYIRWLNHQLIID